MLMIENKFQELGQQSVFFNAFILCVNEIRHANSENETQYFIRRPWRRQLSALNTDGDMNEENWSRLQNGRHTLSVKRSLVGEIAYFGKVENP